MQNIEKITTIHEANGKTDKVTVTTGSLKSKDLLGALTSLFGDFDGILYVWGNGGRIAIDPNAKEYTITTTERAAS